MPHTRRNRLGGEPSLYLRQHSTNPVDWHPWCDAALSLARRQDLPILLSVGYSACHWCHVMERECFDDAVIAEFMNEHFVCIKVDREERPDIDAIYMRAVQAMTGRGGWPMTVFLTPDLSPFYAGTYFPPVDRGGMPGFPRVLRAVSAAYRSRRDRVERTAERIAQLLRVSEDPAHVDLDQSALRDAAASLARSMDSDFGGFGRAPKFPGATSLGFQIGVELVHPQVEQRRLIVTALDAMANGGIYDHLGGGFHRYSVDREWRIPHFEKMLYDQALLVDLYRDAWLAFREPRYREVALGTLEFVRRDLRSTGGGFFAAQDADSEEGEGRYFTWSADELRSAAGGSRDAEVVLAYFGVSDGGELGGQNVLRVNTPADVLARDLGRTETDVTKVIQRVRAELLVRRALRVPPMTDRKILADWNGLMIGAMTSAGRVFGRRDFVECAADAADHVLALLWRDSRLFHFHDEGVTRVEGFVDDYAFLGRGVLELYVATRRPGYLQAAERCAESLLERYEDRQNGGFFFTTADEAPVLHREKQLLDGAVPAGNSAAVDLFCRLHALTGDGRYQHAADCATAAAAYSALRSPYRGASLLAAALSRAVGYTTVVIWSPSGRSTLVEAALDVYLPGLMVLVPVDALQAGDAALLRAQVAPAGGQEAAYVCRSGICALPLHTSGQLRQVLKEVAACGT